MNHDITWSARCRDVLLPQATIGGEKIVHNVLQAIEATVTGFCKIHGTDSQECGAAREVGGALVLAVGGIAVAKALSRG